MSTVWATAAVCLAALLLGLAWEALAFDWDQPARWVPDLLAGWALVGSGVAAWRARRAPAVGWLLIAAGFTWFLGGIWPAAIFWHRGPLMHLLVTYPGWRPRSRLDAAALAVGYVMAVLPGAWGDDAVAVALLAGLTAVVARGYAMAAPRERVSRRVALAATVLLAAVVLGGAVARAVTPGQGAVLPALLAYEAVIVVIAVLLVVRLPTPSPEEVADLVVEIDERGSGSLTSRLARALGDPSLQVGFWSPASNAYLTEDGTALVLPEADSARRATTIERSGHPYALLVHDVQTLADPRLVEAVAGAASLVSTQVALRGAVDEQVRQITESSRRLVIIGDDERARLAARLDRGPQRRLQEIAAVLEVTRRGPGDGPAARALEHARYAQQDLAALSEGLRPRDLGEPGLAGALRRVAARAPLPVEVDADVPVLPGPVEVAAYFVVSEALTNVSKHARATGARIVASVEDEVLVIDVIDDGVGGANPAGSGLTGLADRMSALGGVLEVNGPDTGGTCVRARIPLRAGST